MHDAITLEFTKRPAGFVPVTVQHHIPGNSLRTIHINDARTITLRKDAESVLVQFIQNLDDKTYLGEILGFEPGQRLEFNKMKVGEKIKFSEQHVFGLTE